MSESGDQANWSTGESNAIPGVGGAMDLAMGAKRVFVMTEHTTRTGEPKIVKRCSYPLTGVGVVSTIYSNIAVIDVTEQGLVVREKLKGLELDDVQNMTGAPIQLANNWQVLDVPDFEK